MKRLGCVIFVGLVGCTATIDESGLPSKPPDNLSGGGSAGSSGATGGGGSGTGGGGVVVLPGGVTLDGKPEFFRVVRLTHQQ